MPQRLPLCRVSLSLAALAGLVGCVAPPGEPRLAPLPGPPRGYECHPAAGPIVVDGRLDEAGWSRAAWTDNFVDIAGPAKPAPRHATRMKMAWDAQHLYLGAELEEPHVWATLTKHDSIVFRDNDFEVFIDPDGDARNYYEIEVNALNTVFDLLLVRTYREGGPAWHGWNAAGLRRTTHVDGTLNNPADLDRGWSVEFAIPWPTLAEYATCPAPPRDGDVWRMNFSRVQWRLRIADGRYERIPGATEDNWVWSPQGAVNMHLPDRWGYVTFRGGPHQNHPP